MLPGHPLFNFWIKVWLPVRILRGARSKAPVILDAMSSSPFVSQVNTRQFGRRI